MPRAHVAVHSLFAGPRWVHPAGPRTSKISGAFGVVVDDDLGVGVVAVVDVAEAAADAEDARGELHLAEEPAGDVHLVDALVAEVAVAGVPDPVPVVVEAACACSGQLGRRAAPEVVVDRPAGRAAARRPCRCCRGACSRGRGRAWILPRLPARTQSTAAAMPVRLERLCVPAWTIRLYLRAASTDLAALPDVVRDGLLDIDVLAGLAGPDRRPARASGSAWRSR